MTKIGRDFSLFWVLFYQFWELVKKWNQVFESFHDKVQLIFNQRFSWHDHGWRHDNLNNDTNHNDTTSITTSSFMGLIATQYCATICIVIMTGVVFVLLCLKLECKVNRGKVHQTSPVQQTACIRHQCRKTTVLSCYRCLINTGVEKMNNI